MDAHEILGVAVGATDGEIRDAYCRLAAQLYADAEAATDRTEREDALHRAAAVNVAFQLLTDPKVQGRELLRTHATMLLRRVEPATDDRSAAAPPLSFEPTFTDRDGRPVDVWTARAPQRRHRRRH